MISPESIFTLIWSAFMLLVDLFYTAFWVPVDVAFCSISYGDLSANCTIVEIAGGDPFLLI